MSYIRSKIRHIGRNFSYMSLGSKKQAVEETFPLEPVYSETAIHFPAMTYAFVLINICNNLNWEANQAVADTCGDAIQPLDYTPYYLNIFEYRHALVYIQNYSGWVAGWLGGWVVKN
jgi:hypothetical protein